MGAWGYEPFDNDTALDWIDSACNKAVWNKVKSALESRNHNAIRAAARFTCSVLKGCSAAGPHEYDIRQIAIDGLKRILNDPKWLIDCGNPQVVIKSIDSEIEELQSIKVGTSLFGSIVEGVET